MDILSIVAYIAVGFVAYFVGSFVVLYLKFRKEIVKERMQQFGKDNPLVYIRAEEHNGEKTYLVYNAVNEKFVCQGSDSDSIHEGIIRVFKDKEKVMLLIDENTVAPLYIKGVLENRERTEAC